MATIIKKKHVKYACNSYVYYDPNYKDYKQGNIGLSEVMHNRVFVCVCLCVSTCVCVCACKCVWLCVLPMCTRVTRFVLHVHIMYLLHIYGVYYRLTEEDTSVS